MENNNTDVALESGNQTNTLKLLNRRLVIFEVLTLVLIIAVGFFAVDKFYPAEINRQTANRKQEILNIIKNNYKGDVSTAAEQSNGELAGLVASLKDPYSDFIPKDKINDFQNGLNEKYSGIGIRFSRENSRVFVTQVFKNGPASLAGINIGNELLKVEDKEIKNLNNDQLANFIRGEENSTVNITISTSPKDQPAVEKKITLTRKNVQSDLVSLEVKDDVGVISITSFGDATGFKMGEIAKEIRSNSNIKKLVLDLRSNTGGLLDQSTIVASYFLPENSMFVKENYKNTTKEERTKKVENSLVNYPVIVAVDQSSASASEILAASLRDYRNVKLVGQKTYGKGVVQQIFTLSSGDLLKITIAEWLSPKGEKINGKGLEPDISVDIDKNTIDKAVEEINK